MKPKIAKFYREVELRTCQIVMIRIAGMCEAIVFYLTKELRV